MLQRIHHLLDETDLKHRGMPRKLGHGAEQAAVLGNAGRVQRRVLQPVAQHVLGLFVRVQQSFAQQGRAGLTQMDKRITGWQGGKFLPVAGHAQFLQRAQRLDWLATKGDADTDRTQALESRRNAKGLRRRERRRGEHDINFGVGPLDQCGNGGVRVDEPEKQSAKAEIADFASDIGKPRLRDERRLRHLKAHVAALLMAWLPIPRHGCCRFHIFLHAPARTRTDAMMAHTSRRGPLGSIPPSLLDCHA